MTTPDHPQRRRILYLPLLFVPEPWNGIMEHLRILAAGLPRERYEPLLAIRPGDGDQTATLAGRARLPVVRLPDAFAVRGLASAFGHHRVDLLHAHTPVTAGVPRVVAAARLARCRVLVTYHQVQPHPLPLRSRLINRAAHRFVSSTLAVSGGVASTLAANAGLERSRITVVHNGVAPYDGGPSPARAPGGACTLGYFGRLAEEKDVAALVRAVALLANEGVPVRAIIVGDGYERAALEALARDLGVESAVDILGFRPDARALMRSVDIVVHPPRFEGFGLSLIEAMEAKKPIVATRVAGGITELVTHGENGLLVAPGDPAELARAIRTLIDDPALRERLAADGYRRYGERYRSDVMVRNILGVYEKATGAGARSVEA